MKAEEILFKKIEDGTLPLLTAEEIARRLRLGRRESLALKDMLFSLVRSGGLLADNTGRFGTAEQFGAKRGKIVGNERGFGFFVPDDGSEDLFLPHRALKNALHGDDVLCFRRTGDEGEVLAILGRGVSEVIGTFFFERQGGFVVADEKKFTERVFIAKNLTRGSQNGDKVVAKIKSYDGRMPIGEITEILGKSGDFFIEEAALLRAHGLQEEFPEEVLRKADAEARRDPLLSLDGRLDLRDKLIITVDGEDTRDIDDAISVEKVGSRYLLGVHIADVSHYVRLNGPIDREAFKRGTSVYFPDRVLPMLPTSLSNNICSLNEGAVRLTLSCLMTVDRKGNVIEKKVLPSVICSRHRMTYTEVTAIANGEREAVKRYADLKEFVKIAVELTELLKAARRRRGSVDMDVGEARILYEGGKIEIPDNVRTISHDMIEQFMILANESVAEIMTEKNMPFVYRVHEKPSEEKAIFFKKFLQGIGAEASFDPYDVSPADYQSLLSSLEGTPLASVASRVMLRSMMKAVYSPENIGHFGLASSCYCHFTSPIRRYPDLCVHRIIKDALRDEEAARRKYRSIVKDAAVRSTLCEKNATEAERDVDALYMTAFMQDKLGEEYDAILSGVNSVALYAELSNSVEGMIPVDTLPDPFYTYIEESMLLRGPTTEYRIGQAVRVKVVGVDWGVRRVRFSLLKIL